MPDRSHRQVGLLALTLILILTTGGCSRLPTAGGSRVAMAMSDLPRDTSPTVTEATLSELVGGNNAFAFDLYQAIRQGEGNLFYSPFSISLALAMTYAGARGDTERQMAGTLHYGLPQAELHPAFNALDRELTSPGKGQAAFELHVANSVWGQEGFPFLAPFLDTVATNYGAGLRLVDYAGAGKREQARQAINRWVSDETRGKIKDLIAEDVLTEYTRLVLANAIYFRGEWQDPFTPKSPDGDFHRLDGTTVTVPLMSRRAQMLLAEGEGYQAVELPYKGERIRMVILLPAPGEFQAFEQSLDAGRFQAIVDSLQSEEIKLYLPRFSYRSSLELEKTLADMGMPDAFDPDRADLTGMYDRAREPRNLYLSHVIHKAFVAVDEKGTEAAAATGIVAEIVSMPKEVRVDRPFVFAIRDAQTGSILFVGRVLDPSA